MSLGLAGARHATRVERHGDRRQATTGRVESEDLLDDGRLRRVNDPADAEASLVPVAVGRRRVVQGLPLIPKGDPPCAEPIQGLPFQSPVCLPPEFSDVFRVHGAVDGQEELGVFSS